MNEQDARQLAMGTLQFLTRAQISGAEADNYIAVRNFVTMIANGGLAVTRKEPPVPLPPEPRPRAGIVTALRPAEAAEPEQQIPDETEAPQDDQSAA